MDAEVRRTGNLEQDYAADKIVELFGEEFTYENDNGNTVIGRIVLKAFNSLNPNDVVWSRRERAWRLRGEFDEPGRQQAE